jgi:tetratricopeptide (TPR) repeat protein
MVKSSDKDHGKKKVAKVKTFSVPFALGEKKAGITNTSNTPSQSSKEKLINQAFKFHSQGNISEAVKLYQYFINQGFNDHRIFSNYGTILKDLGKLQEAELSYRKAIKLKPNYANAHSNLGNILRDLGKLQEAEKSIRTAIELNPDFAMAHINLGTILTDLGNLKDAELATRKAIELNPDFAMAFRVANSASFKFPRSVNMVPRFI